MKRHTTAIIGVLTLVGASTLFVITRKYATASTAPQDATAIPSVKSAVEGVEITNATVVADSFGDPVLQVEIKNNTPGTVMFVTLSSGHVDQGRGSKEAPAIEPFGTMTMTFPGKNLQEGKPLALSAVLWADGTSSGYPWQAEHIKKFAANMGRTQ